MAINGTPDTSEKKHFEHVKSVCLCWGMKRAKHVEKCLLFKICICVHVPLLWQQGRKEKLSDNLTCCYSCLASQFALYIPALKVFIFACVVFLTRYIKDAHVKASAQCLSTAWSPLQLPTSLPLVTNASSAHKLLWSLFTGYDPAKLETCQTWLKTLMDIQYVLPEEPARNMLW